MPNHYNISAKSNMISSRNSSSSNSIIYIPSSLILPKIYRELQIHNLGCRGSNRVIYRELQIHNLGCRSSNRVKVIANKFWKFRFLKKFSVEHKIQNIYLLVLFSWSTDNNKHKCISIHTCTLYYKYNYSES